MVRAFRTETRFKTAHLTLVSKKLQLRKNRPEPFRFITTKDKDLALNLPFLKEQLHGHKELSKDPNITPRIPRSNSKLPEAPYYSAGAQRR
ncbi:hypothetical protein CEXT_689921 [Caerostris extrusa]|uniref:Uncharacterized protein n=1 Tax=Caerostris extrusa TaxID=172846 RepID=A0AAV4TAJ9_CAEEX|nr:hypothetical protein CEXT_689921 [Caerostris extrusa]